MDPYKLTFRTVSQVNGQATLQRGKYVTARTDAKVLLKEVVSIFAEGHEDVRLISSDGENMDINLIETVEGLKAGDQVPGISQNSQARTGTILVGAPQRPLQKQHSPFASPSTATPLPGQPTGKAYKRGRVQSQDPEKTTLGKKTADQLSLSAANLLRNWTRALCGRQAEAPWLFHPCEEQQLKNLVIRGLLQRPELAGDTQVKVEKAMKAYMKSHNYELQQHHKERGSNPSVTRGRQNYAAAEKEANKWHEDFGAFDWTSTDIPQAAWTFLEAQGLTEEKIRQIAGISKHESAADGETHFTPAGKHAHPVGKQKRSSFEIEQPQGSRRAATGQQGVQEAIEDAAAGAGKEDHGYQSNHEDMDEDRCADMKVLKSIEKGNQARAARKKEQAQASALKRRQRAEDQMAKEAADGNTNSGGRGGRGGRRGGRGRGRRGGQKT